MLYDLHVLWLSCLVLCIHCIVLPSFVAKLLLINCILLLLLFYSVLYYHCKQMVYKI